jgi:hypothetical protein
MMALLLLVLLAVVEMVYAQRFRDATLSHVTDTKPGELGGEFWLRMGAFVAVPLISLLAAQYPQLYSALFSWFRPAMSALK